MQTELAETVYRFLVSEPIGHEPPREEDVRRLVEDFFELYPARPVLDNAGGSRFHACFWLYLMARRLDPRLIVESGTWKGQTAWLFRQACPAAAVHCFDPNLTRLVYRDRSIQYHERDWAGWEFESVDPEKSLCFFDDHIDQSKRIREAGAKGFRRLLFDDAPPAHKVYSFGYPGLPTVGMLMDPRVEDGEVFEWTWRGEHHRWVFSEADAAPARSLISRYALFPDVAGPTRYGGQAFLSYVLLRAAEPPH